MTFELFDWVGLHAMLAFIFFALGWLVGNRAWKKKERKINIMTNTQIALEKAKKDKISSMAYFDKSIAELEEKEKAESNDWNRRCEHYEYYYYISAEGEVNKAWESGSEFEENCYPRFNYFPCSDFTKEELIAAGMQDAGTLERGAFKKCKDDWMSKEDRLNNCTMGGYVRYANRGKRFEVCHNSDDARIKWYYKTESIEAYAKYLNDNNYNYEGVKK